MWYASVNGTELLTIAPNCCELGTPGNGPCMKALACVGTCPTISMTSISPQPGQHGGEVAVGPSPSSQNAEHSPVPAGWRMRASMRPYLNENL